MNRFARSYLWSLYLFPMGRMKYHGTYGDESDSQSLPPLYPPDDTRRRFAWLNDRSTYLCSPGIDSPYILCRLDGI